MNITCAITDGMNAKEKDIYFAHMEKRHKEEKEYMDARRAELIAWKNTLIDQILESNEKWTREELQKKQVRILEMIASY